MLTAITTQQEGEDFVTHKHRKPQHTNDNTTVLSI